MSERYGDNLGLPGDSKFEGIGFGIPIEAVNDFYDLLEKIAGGSKSWIESFQTAFGGVGQSSSFSWALTDLDSNMRNRSEDAVNTDEKLYQFSENKSVPPGLMKTYPI